MKVVDLVRKYQARIKELRDDINLTMSYGGPIVDPEGLSRQEQEVSILEDVVEDLGKL